MSNRESITLGELQGKLDLLEIKCHRCERRGRADTRRNGFDASVASHSLDSGAGDPIRHAQRSGASLSGAAQQMFHGAILPKECVVPKEKGRRDMWQLGIPHPKLQGGEMTPHSRTRIHSASGKHKPSLWTILLAKRKKGRRVAIGVPLARERGKCSSDYLDGGAFGLGDACPAPGMPKVWFG